jgi:hypothetical protein
MNNEYPTEPQKASENSLIKPTKYSNWLIGILGAISIALALTNMSKNSKISLLKEEVISAQTAADKDSYEKGYLQAIWDAYFEQPRYVIDDTKNEPVLWKQMPLDENVKKRVASFKAELDRQMEEGPSQN